MQDRKKKPKFPSRALQESIGKNIRIKLKDDTEYGGIALEIDTHMNVLLKNPVEYYGGKEIATYSELYVRGTSIFYIQLDIPISIEH